MRKTDIKKMKSKGRNPSQEDFDVKGKTRYDSFYKGIWIRKSNFGYVVKFPSGYKARVTTENSVELETMIDNFLDSFDA